MDVSSDAAVTAAIWERLTDDPELQRLFGDRVRVYLDWGQPDSELPYIVHTLETTAVRPWPVRRGRYVLDVWDYSETAVRIATIQRRVTELLEMAWIEIGGGPAGVRMRLERWRPITEGTRYIWRRSSEWSVRFVATPEMQGILGRG